MKKLVTLLLSMILIVSLLTACGKSKDAGTDAAAKTGLGVVTSLASSTSAGDADGLAEVDSTVAAVLVGSDGKILACRIDVAQTKANFSAEGKLLTDVATEFQTKQERGADYGMASQSGIGKEWYQQADAFADYVVGKTVDEVKGIAVSEEGVTTEADLTSSVTIHVGDFISAIEKAVSNAKDLGASANDKLGLAISTSISDSTDATADAVGLVQAYSYYSVVTTDADKKITSCVVDASQGKVNFDTTGTITTDLTAAVQTKQELKEAYNMKDQSGIGKEWYEQANSFADYVKGKTIDQVNGIAVSEEGVATEADLTSSVTIHITPLISVVDKAVTNAK